MRVLAVGDLHSPFQHKRTYEFLEGIIDEYSPDEIVLMGDIADVHNPSAHGSDPSGMSAGDELKAAKTFLKELAILLPEAKVCHGNHTDRYHRRAYDSGLPSEVIKSLAEIYETTEGWEWGDEFLIDEVLYTHDHLFSGEFAALKGAKHRMRSCVFGHLHSNFGVNYFANGEHLIFGASAGCLIDHHAYSMAYGKKIKFKPILGSLIIDDGKAVTPIPMIL